MIRWLYENIKNRIKAVFLAVRLPTARPGGCPLCAGGLGVVPHAHPAAVYPAGLRLWPGVGAPIYIVRDKRLACLAPPNTRQSVGPVFSATVAKCVLDAAVFRPAPTGTSAPITGAYGSGAGFPGAGFWPFEPPGGPIVMALRRVAIVCLLLKCRILAIKRLIIKNTPPDRFWPGGFIKKVPFICAGGSG